MSRPRLQRSVSEHPAPLRRSSSLYRLLTRVPSFRHGWSNGDVMDDYSSAEEEQPIAPPSPTVSPEEAKRVRKKKLQRLFKLGVSKVMKERAMEMNRMAKLASLYALDAFAGRLQHGMAAMSTRPWYIFAAFRLQISREWLWCIIAASLAHSMLVFLEPTRHHGGGGAFSGGTLRALEALFIAVYVVDVSLKVAYMGLTNYLKKPWQKLMIAIVLVLAIDASGLFAVRFARFLRPAILSLRTRSIRRFYAVVSNMLPGFLRVCLPVLFFLLLSASFAALSFGRAKGEFENSMSAGYAIWILMVSADNYGSLVDEPSQHPAYIPFIVMVIIVGSMFLLSLLLGVTYDVFIEHTTEQVKSERLKELRGLNKAFAIMDPEGKGKLSMVVWDRFLHNMMPRTTQQERALYFEIASGFADELDVLGFMDLRQVLSYRFVNVNAVERQGKRLKWERKPRWLVRLLETMEGALHAQWWQHIVAAVVLLDCLFLPYGIPHQGPGLHITRLTTWCGVVLLVDQAFQWAEWMRQGSGPGPLRLPGKSFHTKVAGTAVLAHTAVVAVIYCPPLLSLACSGAAWASGAWSSLVASILSPRNGDCSWFDCVGDGAGGGSGGAGEGGGYSGEVSSDNWGWCPVEDDVFWASDGGAAEGVGGGMCRKLEWCMDGIVGLAYTMRLMRCWRLVTLNDTLHAHVDTFFSVVPVFAQTLSFALIVAYGFALGGMLFFADKASAFKDAGTSLKTTLQLFVGVDFSAVVEDTVNEVGPSAFLYFALYHVVGVLIVFNLLTAIMIQLYGEALNEKSRQNLEDQRKADQLLQDSLYEHNQKQRVLRLWGRSLTQRAAKLNITRATAVNTGAEARRVLGSATKSAIPTEEELTACQSYAKVDLVRALQEKTRGDRSIRTFERSLYQKLKSTGGSEALNYQSFAHGDIIYQRGDHHHCCYFVHKGVVRLEATDGTTETKETGEMFGEEALVANLATCATARAAGPVECVSIDRATFTEAHGTLENLGHIFLRLQRSGSLSGMDTPLSDAGSGRRSLFSQGGAGSGRGSRMGFGMTRSGDLDGSGSDMRSERWRSNRNIAHLSHHRSSRNYGDEGDGNSGGGDWSRRRGNSNVSDRNNTHNRNFSSSSGLSGRGDSFGPGSSIRSDTLSRGNGNASVGSVASAGAEMSAGRSSGPRATEPRRAETSDGSDNQQSKASGLFNLKPALATETRTRALRPTTVGDASSPAVTFTATATADGEQSRAGVPGSACLLPSAERSGDSKLCAERGLSGVNSSRNSRVQSLDSGEEKRGYFSFSGDASGARGAEEGRPRIPRKPGLREILQLDKGRVGASGVELDGIGSDKAEEGAADGERLSEVGHNNQCSLDLVSASKSEGPVGDASDKVEEGAKEGNGLGEVDRNNKRSLILVSASKPEGADVDTKDIPKKNADVFPPIAPAPRLIDLQSMPPRPPPPQCNLDIDDEAEACSKPTDAAASGHTDTKSSACAFAANTSGARAISKDLLLDTGEGDIFGPGRPPGTGNGETEGRSARSHQELIREKLSDGDTGGQGVRAIGSMEFSDCGEAFISPELSPSAAPVVRKGGAMFPASFGRRSSLSRRTDGQSAGGSGVSSAWSTNSPSPSPVMTTSGGSGVMNEE